MEKPHDHSFDYVLSSHDQLFSFDRTPSPLVRANKSLFFFFKSRHYFQSFLQRLTLRTREWLWSRCLSPARGRLVCLLHTLYVLIVRRWFSEKKKKKNIHNSWAPRFRRVTQPALVIFPARDPKPLSMNNHGSLKSICSECVARIKSYPKNDRVDDLIRCREFVCWHGYAHAPPRSESNLDGFILRSSDLAWLNYANEECGLKDFHFQAALHHIATTLDVGWGRETWSPASKVFAFKCHV